MSDLRTWRADQKKTLSELAVLLNVGGIKPERTVQRFETGERPVSLEMALLIQRITDGAVDPADMDATRQAWLARQGTEAAA